MADDSGHSTPPTGSQSKIILPGYPFPNERASEYIDELITQTDRGCAVLGAAFLEWRIRQTIKKRLFHWDKGAERIFGNDKRGGELGFIDQAKVAQCLGLIGSTSFADIERIARIRNRFAHHVTVSTFEGDEAARTLCDELQSPELRDQYFGRKINKRLTPTGSRSELLRERYLKTIEAIGNIAFKSAVRHKVTWYSEAIAPKDFW